MPVIQIIDKQHWHDLRHHHVGASDVSALFPGVGGFKSHFELWVEKSGKLTHEELDSERVDLGNALEWPIIEVAGKRNGWTVSKPLGYSIHDNVQGMGCTPDAIISDENGRLCLGELKVVDYVIFKQEWIDGEPPLKYLLQLQHQLACTGFYCGKIIAYIIGSGIKIYHYERHEHTIALIEHAVRTFWQDVKNGKEPKISADDYDVVRAMYGETSGETIDLSGDNELPSLCAAYQDINRKRLETEKEEKRLKAEIINKIGSAAEATTSGFRIRYPEILKNMKAKEAHVQRYRQLTIKEA